MKQRNVLKQQLTESWKQCLELDYPKGIINGERALQACLYHRLISRFVDDQMEDRRSVFIEPCIKFHAEGVQRMPDMVICDTKRVIAIVELKFHPRVRLNAARTGELRTGAQKDLQTLVRIARDVAAEDAKVVSDSPRITVTNERYLGKGSGGKAFALAPNMLFVWAGIYRRGDESPSRLAHGLEQSGLSIHGRVFELHARTQSGQQPDLSDPYSS